MTIVTAILVENGQNRPLMMLAKFSIPKFSEWQLFGKQIDIMTVSLRPKAVYEKYKKSVSEWLVYIDHLTSVLRSFSKRLKFAKQHWLMGF
ncbi:hypothetical protein [Methylomonas koyamae]|uniref:hypothetical protein n=1 Tax=Methylomonas koyamae TaxID=702114 RepID=UPI0006D2B1FA|nr:hypothetical protein [Methylomonas koyamae]